MAVVHMMDWIVVLYTDRKNHLGERNDAFERKLFVAFETNDHSLTVKEYSLTVNTRRQIT